MSVAPVEKIELLAYAGIKMDFLSSLQEEGLIHIEESALQELEQAQSTPELVQLDHDLHRINQALDRLSAWEIQKKKRGKGRGPGSKLRIKKSLRLDALKNDYHSVLDEIDAHEAKKNEVNSHIKFIEREKLFLEPLVDLDAPVRSLVPTLHTKVYMGTIQTAKFETLQKEIEDLSVCIREICRDKRNTIFLIIYHNSEAEQVEQILKILDFNPLYFTEPVLDRADDQDGVAEVLSKLEIELADTRKKFDEVNARGGELIVHRDVLMQVYDVLMNEREKVSSTELLGETKKTFHLEGWILSSDKDKLLSKLEPYNDLIEYYFRAPQDDENPPVALKNKKIWKPFEVITKLYGLPQKGSMDPTIALAPFFFIFVGLTVSEAGYGMLIGLLSLLFLKLVKPRGGLQLFLSLLVILSVSIVVLGTLVGGWFGFPIRRLMILDPLQDPVSFLVLSLALGFIQVWFGTLLNLITEFKKKEYLQAIFVQGGWLVLLPSLVLYGVAKSQIAGIFTLVGAAGIIFFASPSRNPIARFFGGLYSLYDISRYLADILSYSRLLALGLATSVIAMVVNTLCQTALKIPLLGWLFAAMIFLGGHLFNLGISLLGGFVHSMRLQFVEFFSKFFTSGGQPFKPLELESKYTEIV